MKTLSILGLVLNLVASPAVHAEGKKGEVLATKDLCAGISMHAEVWQLDDTTKVLRKRLGPVDILRFGAAGERAKNSTEEPKDYACRMRNMSTHGFGEELGEVNVGIQAKIFQDGKIQLEVAQYAKTQRGKRGAKDLDKPILSEIFDISDLRTAQVITKSSTGRLLLLRFLPMMSMDGAPRDATDPVIGGRDTIIFDSQRNVWVEDITFGAPYVKLTTMHGTIAFSFRRFRGSDAMGDAKGRRLELRLPDGRLLSFVSESDFLPIGERYTVYGRYWPERKSHGPGSIGTSESTTLEDFENRLDEAG